MKQILHYNAKIVERNFERSFEPLTPKLYQRIMEQYEVGESVVIKVEPMRLRRSASQNAYYWVYVGVIAAETGNNEMDLHEYFKRAFLPPRYVNVLGQEIKLPNTTTELSKGEFAEYIQKITAMTNVPPPDPEAAGYISANKPYH